MDKKTLPSISVGGELVLFSVYRGGSISISIGNTIHGDIDCLSEEAAHVAARILHYVATALIVKGRSEGMNKAIEIITDLLEEGHPSRGDNALTRARGAIRKFAEAWPIEFGRIADEVLPKQGE